MQLPNHNLFNFKPESAKTSNDNKKVAMMYTYKVAMFTTYHETILLQRSKLIPTLSKHLSYHLPMYGTVSLFSASAGGGNGSSAHAWGVMHIQNEASVENVPAGQRTQS